jgi:hypothetical protein
MQPRIGLSPVGTSGPLGVNDTSYASSYYDFGSSNITIKFEMAS